MEQTLESKPKYYCGDNSGGPLEALDAQTYEAAIEEARGLALDRARSAAVRTHCTSLQDWTVVMVRSDGEEDQLTSGLEQIDPEEPTCKGGIGDKHDWYNPDPEWAGYGEGYGHTPPGGVTVVRACRKCKCVRTEVTRVPDHEGGHYDSVQYEWDILGV